MRTLYRRRRDALVEALSQALPEAAVGGAAAGLHVTLQLPDTDDEEAIREQARRRQIDLETMNDYRAGACSRPSTLLLGYGRLRETAIACRRPGARRRGPSSANPNGKDQRRLTDRVPPGSTVTIV